MQSDVAANHENIMSAKAPFSNLKTKDLISDVMTTAEFLLM